MTDRPPIRFQVVFEATRIAPAKHSYILTGIPLSLRYSFASWIVKYP
jgi:hypothetical protein